MNEELKYQNLLDQLCKLKAENEVLRQNEELLKHIINSCNDYFYSYDLNRRFPSANLTFSKFLNLSENNIIGKTYEEHGFPQNQCNDWANLRQLVLRTNNTVKTEIVSPMPDGHIHYFEVILNPLHNIDGQIIGIGGSTRDITEWKLNEIELKKAKEMADENEQKLKNAHEIAKLGSWELDVKTGIFTFTDSFYKLLHTTAEKVGGYQMTIENYTKQFVHPDDRIKLTDEIKKAIVTDKPGFSRYIEHRVVYDKDDNGFFAGRFYIIEDKNGTSIKVYGVNQDITEKRRYEDKLKIALEKAQECDRLKKNILRNLSHEIRTPLNLINGFSELISLPDQSPEKIVQYSQIINNSIGKFINIFSDVIEMSLLQTKNIQVTSEKIEFISVITNICNTFTNKLTDKNIDYKININFPDKELFIISDFQKLNRIFLHLIDNAIKFTPRGAVTISCNLLNTDHNQWIECIIKDSGIGISSEMQKMIFEPFAQVETGTTRKYGGIGLGLALIKGYIELLGGTIQLKSEINIGTLIKVLIPANQEQKPNSRKSDKLTNKSNKKRVFAEEG